MLAIIVALKSKLVQAAMFLAACAGVVLAVYTAGKGSAKTDQTKDQLKSAKTKADIDAQVSRMPADAARDELRQWSKK